MSFEVEVDGSFFIFEDGWQVEKIDEWSEQNKLTGQPFNSKGCDLVAVNGNDLWFIEAKDYTYPGASVPDNLAETVGVKMFHSLAVLHATAKWGNGDHAEFSSRSLNCSNAKICLAVELPHGGRRMMGVEKPLADLKDGLKAVTRKLMVTKPTVSNSFVPSGVPWTVRRDPSTRGRHSDR